MSSETVEVNKNVVSDEDIFNDIKGAYNIDSENVKVNKSKSEPIQLDEDILNDIKDIEDGLLQYYNILAFKFGIKEYEYKYKKILTMFHKRKWDL